jgi:hypothetical protein
MMSYIDATLQASSNGASSRGRVGRCTLISTREYVGITLHQEGWSGRLLDNDFTG